MKDKFVVYDVGARGGLRHIIPAWLPTARPVATFRDLFEAYGFEPDPEEFQRMHRVGDFDRLFDDAIGRSTGPAKLYVTRQADKSSTLEPDLDIIRKHFAGDAELYAVDKVVTVQCRSLDEVADEIGALPDWIKLDTQGSEHDILEGAPRCLDHAGVLFLELSSLPQYRDQKVAMETVQSLVGQGFDILATNYKLDAPYENDFVFLRRIDESNRRQVKSAATVMTLLGLDAQAGALLKRTGMRDFARALGRRRRLAVGAVAKRKAIRAVSRRLTPDARRAIKNLLRLS